MAAVWLLVEEIGGTEKKKGEGEWGLSLAFCQEEREMRGLSRPVVWVWSVG